MLVWTVSLDTFLRVKSIVRSWTRNFAHPQLLLEVVEARLRRIEAMLILCADMLRQENGIARILANRTSTAIRIGRLVGVLALVEEAERVCLLVVILD